MTKTELHDFNILPYKNLLYTINSNKKTIAFVHGTHMGKSIIVMKALKEVGRLNRILFISNKSAHETIESNNEYGLDIQYCTYNYFSNYEKVLNAYHNYDTFIVDEMHHAGSDIYGDNVQKLLKMIETDHTDTKIGIGMTATPRRADGINVCQYFQSYVQGITLYDAIHLGIVKNPNYVMCGDKSIFDRIMEDVTIEELNAVDVDWNNKDSKDLLKNSIENHKTVDRWIVITNTIEECSDLKPVMREAFPEEYKIEVITSEEQTCELDEYLHNKDKVVFISCMKLIESVHLPLINGIINVRHIVTKSLFEQIMGRTTSPYSRKAPVFLDFAYIYLRMRSIMKNNFYKNNVYDDEPDIVELFGHDVIHPYRIDIDYDENGNIKYTVHESDEEIDNPSIKAKKDESHDYSTKSKDVMDTLNISSLTSDGSNKLTMKKVNDIIKFLYTPRYGSYYTLKELWKGESKLFTIKLSFDQFMRMVKKFDDDWKTVLDICKNKGIIQYKDKNVTIKDVHAQYIKDHKIKSGLDFKSFQRIFIDMNYNIKKTIRYVSLGKVIDGTYFSDIRMVYKKYKDTFVPNGKDMIDFNTFNDKVLRIKSIEETIRYFQEGKYSA